MDAYAALFMAIVLIVQTVVSYLERRRLIKQNDDLMNRLMSVDFQSYAAGRNILSRGVKRGGEAWKEKEDQDDTPEKDYVGLSVT